MARALHSFGELFAQERKTGDCRHPSPQVASYRTPQPTRVAHARSQYCLSVIPEAVPPAPPLPPAPPAAASVWATPEEPPQAPRPRTAAIVRADRTKEKKAIPL